MFRTRISFPFFRIFRLRRHRETKEDASPANVTRMSRSPSRSRHLVSSQLKPVNTTPNPSTRRPRSFFISFPSPIPQSPLTTSPDVTPVPGAPPTILIIGRDSPQSTLALPPASAPPGDVGPQAQVDGVSLLESPPVPNTHRVSFQLPTTNTEDCPASPLSTCSTLVTEAGAQAEAETVIAPQVPSEQPPAPEALGSGSVGVASAEPIAELPNRVRSGLGRARPISLFSPQPVRADVSRFSLPVTPTAAGTNARDGKRESKRTSFMRPTSGSGSTKKEKRLTRWSRELSKPETQAVLSVLRGL